MNKEDKDQELQRLKQENEELKANNCRIQSNLIQQLEYEKKLLEDAIKLKQENAQLNITLEEINNNLAEILATIEEEGKPNHSIVDTIWCKNIPCCTIWELVEGMQNKINEVLDER